MDRRRFLEQGLFAAGGLSLAGAKAQAAGEEAGAPRMKYRTLGRTGLEVSEVCFGTYGWQNTAVMQTGIEAGLNLICTCPDYQSGAAERAIAPALAGRRERVAVLSGPTCDKDPDERQLLARAEESLKNLGTDRLEIFLAHQAESVKNIENPAIPRAFEKLKKAGKARFLGISTHNADLEQMLGRAIGLGYFDVLLCRYNFMEYPRQMELFQRAAEAGIGVIVFKVRAGAREHEVQALEAKGLELGMARVRWALSNPHVSSVCVHFSSFGAVQQAREAVSKQLSLEDERLLEQYRLAFGRSYCRFCGSCAGACPRGVDIARVMRYRMYFTDYGLQKAALEGYHALPPSCRPEACEHCPAPCQTACPHGLATRDNLLRAREELTLA